MSDQDPLARFRTGRATATPELRAPVPNASAASGEYKAFYASDAGIYLKIRRPGEFTHRPYYTGLVDVIDDEPHGTNGVLMFSTGMIVMITGRNLAGMFEAVARHQVEWMEAFDAERFKQRPGPDEPFIDKIEIVFGGQSGEVPAAQKQARAVDAAQKPFGSV